MEERVDLEVEDGGEECGGEEDDGRGELDSAEAEGEGDGGDDGERVDDGGVLCSGGADECLDAHGCCVKECEEDDDLEEEDDEFNVLDVDETSMGGAGKGHRDVENRPGDECDHDKYE